MRKRYNTPHRSRVVKTRMTEEEYAEFAERLSACNMSQAEFIRQAITGAAIHKPRASVRKQLSETKQAASPKKAAARNKQHEMEV